MNNMQKNEAAQALGKLGGEAFYRKYGKDKMRELSSKAAKKRKEIKQANKTAQS